MTANRGTTGVMNRRADRTSAGSTTPRYWKGPGPVVRSGRAWSIGLLLAVICRIGPSGAVAAAPRGPTPSTTLADITMRSQRASSFVVSEMYGRQPRIEMLYKSPNLLKTETTTHDSAGRVKPLVVIYIGSRMYTSDIERPGLFFRSPIPPYALPSAQAFNVFGFARFVTNVNRHGNAFNFTIVEPGLSPGAGTAVVHDGYLKSVTFPAYSQGTVLGKATIEFSDYNSVPTIAAPAPSQVESGPKTKPRSSTSPAP
jgi:hypothetical protein